MTVPGTARVCLAVVRLLAAAQARRTSAVPGIVTNHDYEAHMSGQFLFYHNNERENTYFTCEIGTGMRKSEFRLPTSYTCDVTMNQLWMTSQ